MDDGRQSPRPGTHAKTAVGAMRSAGHYTPVFMLQRRQLN